MVVIFLGIIGYTEAGDSPTNKLEELKKLIMEWKRKQSCTKREFLCLGKLSHATKVVTAGRTLLHRMIDTSMSVQRLNHHIKLTPEFHFRLGMVGMLLTLVE